MKQAAHLLYSLVSLRFPFDGFWPGDSPLSECIHCLSSSLPKSGLGLCSPGFGALPETGRNGQHPRTLFHGIGSSNLSVRFGKLLMIAFLLV